MIAQPDGKVVLAGRFLVAGGDVTMLVRYNPDGSLDSTFGAGGVVRLPGDSYPDDGAVRALFSPGAAHLAAQADGKLLVTQVLGDDGSATGADLVVVRLNADGSLDSSFGAAGKAALELGAIDVPQDLAVQADGKIVLAVDAHVPVIDGDSTTWLRTETHIVRLNADGSRDTGFGTDGVVTQAHTLQQITAPRIAIGLDGHVLLMGQDFNAGGAVRTFLMRFNAADGPRDATFGAGGKIILTDANMSYAALLVQPDGKLVLSGGLANGPESDMGLFSQRLNADGTPDATYGAGGTTRLDLDGSYGGAAALQQDGSVVVTGFARAASPVGDHDVSDVIVARFQGDAGAAGSTHFSLRRGIDQQAQYTGKPAAHHHRSPKRRAMEEAAAATGKRHHRSPKRRAQDLARQQAAAALAAVPASSSVFHTRRAIDDG